MAKFIMKHKQDYTPSIKSSGVNKVENNINENKQVMTTSEKIEMVNSILTNNDAPKSKRIKKDKGLIERTESSKIVLTEDNKELLID